MNICRCCFLPIVAIVWAACSAAYCEEFKTIDGKVFKDVLVIEETSTHVKFKHNDGLSKIAKDRLISNNSPEAGSKSGVISNFSSADRIAFMRAKCDSFKTKDARVFLTKDLNEVTPNQMKFVTDSGIIRLKFTDLPLEVAQELGWDKNASDSQDSKDAIKEKGNQRKREQYANAESVINTSAFEARIQPFQRVNAGWLCNVSERKTQTVSVEVARDFNALSGQVQVRTKNVEVDVSGPSEVALVWGLADSIVRQNPKHSWSSPLYVVGKYKYSSLDGGDNLVTTYFTDRNMAISHLANNGLGVVDDADVTKNETGKIIMKGFGSGFLISKDGYIATNHHVVEDAKSVKVSTKGKVFDAKVLAIDDESDLAILKIDSVVASHLHIKADKDVAIGDEVFTIGFPRPSSQGFNPKFTDGTISSLTGLSDSDVHFQISVPIQPGNSGGALVDSSGAAVGIIVSTLNYQSTVSEQSGLPQNVNFAVKSSYLLSLCSKAGVSMPVPEKVSDDIVRTKKAIIGEAEKAAVLIEVEKEN
jgi:S1-C subfamily serine protease